jgi:hypothetical protein
METRELREESMGRRKSRGRTPALELLERRELLSLVTNIMAINHNGVINSPKVRAMLAGDLTPHVSSAASGGPSAGIVASAGRGGFTPTNQSIALPENQGFLPPAHPGYNLILQPTGTASPAEVKRQLFTAVYRGNYVIAPGSFSSQSSQVFIRGAGTASSMLHSDIQMRLAVASDPSLETTGALGIFDRNLNSNTVLGLDLATPRTNVDSRGRPNHITSVTLDVNASAGVYDEAFAQGVIDIHYHPTSTKIPGVSEQGTVVVKIHAQIYSGLVAFILRNSDINP